MRKRLVILAATAAVAASFAGTAGAGPITCGPSCQPPPPPPPVKCLGGVCWPG